MFYRKCLIVCLVLLYLRYSECVSGITGQTVITKSITVGIEQRIEQESIVDITCTEKQTDQPFTITTSNGTIIDATYSCAPPQALYNGTLVGWVPEFVLGYIAEIYKVSTSSNSSSPRLVQLINTTADENELNANPTTSRRLLSEQENQVNVQEQEKHTRMMNHLSHYRRMFDSHAMHPDNINEPDAYETEMQRHEDVLAAVLTEMSENGDIDPKNELERAIRKFALSVSKHPAGRRLLEGDSDLSQALLYTGPVLGVGLSVIAYKAPFAGNIINGFVAGSALGATASNSAAINELLEAFSELQEDVTSLYAAVNAAALAREYLTGNLTRQDNLIGEVFLNITTLFETFEDFALNQATITDASSELDIVTQNAITMIAQEASANFTAMVNALQTSSEVTFSLTDAVLLVTDSMTEIERKISFALVNVTRDAAEARERMAEEMVANLAQVSANSKFNLRAVKTLASIVYDGDNAFPTRRKFALILQQTIKTMASVELSDNSQTYEFKPFTRNAGIQGHQSGDPLFEKYSYLPMDEITIVHRGWDNSQQSLAQTRVYQDKYALNCRTSYVVGKSAFAFNWDDLTDSLAPVGCTPQNNLGLGTTDTPCDCFIDRTRKYCDVTDPGAFDSNPDLLDDFETFAGTDSSAWCGPVVDDTGIPEPVIRSIIDLYEALYDMCVIGDYDNGYNIGSAVLGRTAVANITSLHELDCIQPVDFSPGALPTTGDKQAIVQKLMSATDGRTNVIKSFADMFILSRPDAIASREVEWEHNHWGQIPSDVKFDTIPFNDGNEGAQYMTGASQYATMCFTAPTDPSTGDPAPYIPVYNFEKVIIKSSISVTIDGVTTETTDIQTTDSWNGLLVPQLVFFGNPYQTIGSGFTRYVFDVRQTDASISRMAREREGSVTYLMIRADTDDPDYMPSDKFHSAESWIAENPSTIFDAGAAINSLHLHARTIVEDPSISNKYACVTSRAEDGILCQMLDHYQVEAPNDLVSGSDTRLIFTADEFTTQGTIIIKIFFIVITHFISLFSP
jgi:hypothetical protein